MNKRHLRLTQLKQIAETKSEIALSSLSEITLQCERIRAELVQLETEAQEMLKNSIGVEAGAHLQRWLRLRDQRRRKAMARLAELEVERAKRFRSAQSEFGRKIALKRIGDQAS